jgi:hypothetical protein
MGGCTVSALQVRASTGSWGWCMSTVCSDTSTGKGTTLAEDHDATITGNVAFHQVLMGSHVSADKFSVVSHSQDRMLPGILGRQTTSSGETHFVDQVCEKTFHFIDVHSGCTVSLAPESDGCSELGDRDSGAPDGCLAFFCLFESPR